MQKQDNRKTIGALLICLTICLWLNFPRPENKPQPIYEEPIVEDVVETPKPTATPTPVPTPTVEEITPEVILNEDEFEYVARCVFAEAGNQDYLGQVYVVDCILNRYDTGSYKTYTDVINAPGQFSVVSNGSIKKIKPSETTYKALEDELVKRTNYEIKYFRTKHYHNFGTPCFQHGDHYFSK